MLGDSYCRLLNSQTDSIFFCWAQRMLRSLLAVSCPDLPRAHRKHAKPAGMGEGPALTVWNTKWALEGGAKRVLWSLTWLVSEEYQIKGCLRKLRLHQAASGHIALPNMRRNSLLLSGRSYISHYLHFSKHVCMPASAAGKNHPALVSSRWLMHWKYSNHTKLTSRPI